MFILGAASAIQEVAAKAGITKDAPICHFVKLQNSEWCVFPRGAILRLLYHYRPVTICVSEVLQFRKVVSKVTQTCCTSEYKI